jgi:5-methyltetrahydropteroyltriglutamate--homocysteine methyltransferase
MSNEVKFEAPFRAEHVGSLLRPRELKDAFRSAHDGKLDERGFREVEDRAMLSAIKLQEEVGLESITDGEFRRTAWSTGLLRALDGLEDKPSLFEFHDALGNSQSWDTCFAARPIRRARGITTGEYEFVRRHTDSTPKVTMPAPSFLHFFRGNECADAKAYPNLDQFWSDLIGIYRAELADLRRIGATYVQFDEVPLAMLCDEAVREKVRTRDENPDSLMEKYIGAVNEIVEMAPAGMTVGMHLCRGNLRGKWMAAGGCEAIAEKLFNTLRVGAFFLEYDSTRSGDFAPLRFMPQNQRVILGIVGSKTPVLESKVDLKKRIGEAANYVPIEQMGVSPQCGFASTAGGNPLTLQDEIAKLRLVVETAREVWR